ncbi:hypothetical protein [Amycolatopsis kentuckyensis]|uniref:hypothetical protein n=1 Tax=Amycolatopsis kentuckyensis TaxID=218823 RepID=UPI00356995B4
MLSALLYTLISLLIVLLACAGYVSIFIEDEDHAKRAFAVLKYLGWLLLGGGGAFAAYLKLHELGLF